MDCLGVKLIGRLYETLERQFLGPSAIRREGRAQTDVERQRRLVEAQTQVDVEDVLSRHKRLTSNYELVESSKSVEGVAADEVVQMARRAIVADVVRSQVNVANAVLVAESELRDDPQEPPDQQVDDDWFYRWRKAAGEVSSERLQNVWGRILAGEIKSPASFSLRTLDAVKNLSQEDVMVIDTVAPYVIVSLTDSFVVLDAPNRETVTLDVRFHLHEIGVLAKPYSISTTTVTLPSVRIDLYMRVLTTNDRALVVRSGDPQAKLKLGIYKVTRTGKEMFRIGQSPADGRYLSNVARLIEGQGFDVTLSRRASDRQ